MGGGKPSLLCEWPAVIEEEDAQVNLASLTGMAERQDLIGTNQIALPLRFKERRENRQLKEGREDV